MLDALKAAEPDQIIAVTGHRADEVKAFITAQDCSVQCVENTRYDEDTNILSTEVGVSALRHPENGYLIVETDVMMRADGWSSLLTPQETPNSFWATSGFYCPEVTGGALQCDQEGWVSSLVYAPEFDPTYKNWPKLFGALYVGPQQVSQDRSLRQDAIRKSIKQYYMSPWLDHLDILSCRQLDLTKYKAKSFNDVAAYDAVSKLFAT